MMSPNITLYRKDNACSFIPHALLNELDIPYSEIVLKLENEVMVRVFGVSCQIETASDNSEHN